MTTNCFEKISWQKLEQGNVAGAGNKCCRHRCHWFRCYSCEPSSLLTGAKFGELASVSSRSKSLASGIGATRTTGSHSRQSTAVAKHDDDEDDEDDDDEDRKQNNARVVVCSELLTLAVSRRPVLANQWRAKGTKTKAEADDGFKRSWPQVLLGHDASPKHQQQHQASNINRAPLMLLLAVSKQRQRKQQRQQTNQTKKIKRYRLKRRQLKTSLLPPSAPLLLLVLLLLLLLLLLASSGLQFVESHVIYVKVGALFEESDHEQANMFIRTIKMINVRRDETIRQLLNLSGGSSGAPASSSGAHQRQLTGRAHQHQHQNQQGQRQQHQQRQRQWQTEPQHLWFGGSAAPGNGSIATAAAAAAREAATFAATDNDDANNDNSNNNPDGEETGSGAAGGGVIVKLEPMVEFLSDRDSSLEADGKVCQLIESGVHALVGPTDGASIQHVQSICDNMEIPYFELRPFLGSLQAQAAIGSPLLAPQPPFSTTTTTTSSGNNGLNAAAGLVADSGEQLAWRPLQVAQLASAGTVASGAQMNKMKQQPQSKQKLDDSDNFPGNGFETQQQEQQKLLLQSHSSSLQQTGAAADTATVVALAATALPNLGAAGAGGGDGNGGEADSNEDEVMLADALAPPLEASFQSQAAQDNHFEPTQQNQKQQQERLQLLALSAQAVANNIGDGAAEELGSRLEDLTLNLYPPAHLLTSAYIDLIYAWNWTSFAIVYEDGNSMIKLQDLFKESSGTWTSKWQIKLFQFNPTATAGTTGGSNTNGLPLDGLVRPTSSEWPNSSAAAEGGRNQSSGGGFNALSAAPSSGSSSDFEKPFTAAAAAAVSSQLFGADGSNNQNNHYSRYYQKKFKRHSTFRDIFWRIKQIGEQNILLDVRTESLYEALKNAQQVGCMTERYSYLVTSLDLHTIDLEDFKYSRTRITAFNLIQVTKSHELADAVAAAAQATTTASSTQPAAPPQEKSNNRRRRDGLLFESAAAAAAAAGQAGAQASESGNSDEGVGQFNEKYLEKLGVHVMQGDEGSEPRWHQASVADNTRYQVEQQSFYGNFYQPSRQPGVGRLGGSNGGSYSSSYNSGASGSNNRLPIKYRLSPSVVLDKQGSFMEPPSEVYKDWNRKEQSLSSPASMGLLPKVDRDNEQRLFQFFIEQQERNLSRVRFSTSSAILHDSLLLYMLGLNELDPSGSFLGEQQAIACSLNSHPWLHGSSLVNYMRRISFIGLTGAISFDQRGLRSEFKLDMMGVAPDIGLIKVGEWRSKYAAAAAAASSIVVGSGPGSSSSSASHVIAAVNAAANSNANGDPRESYQLDRLKLATTMTRVAIGPNAAAASSNDAIITSNVANSFESQQQDKLGLNLNSNLNSNFNEKKPWEEDNTAKSYDELSSLYESQLKHYKNLLANGVKVAVPYTKPMSRHGALSVNEIIFNRLYRDQVDQMDTLIVTTKLSQPYFMLKETPNKLEGNDQYEGFAVDLIHELSKLVNFKYKWREVADKKYGSKEVLPNGTVVWNGMIGEIVRGQADLAIVDFTITAQREEAVDFTLPFMNTGISILFKKPTTKVTTLFSFLSPFSSDVWAYVLAAYCGISAILFVVGHLSPYEWADPHPCRHSSINGAISEEDDLDNDNGVATAMLKNQFSLLNSFWFTIGSLMQQGSDLTPRSMSTRTIAGIWYFFTLIMISSYTANLAAFLTVEKVVYPIENVRDLSNQEEIKYGCVESGSTCTFFHDSQIDTYKRINETMRRFSTYVRSNDEGQKRVEEGKFAFFMESASIEYIVERNCNLTQIGGLLDSKGYGLATSKKSRLKRPYRTLLSEGILHLQETGMLHVLKNRWWKERRGGGTCTDDGKGGGVTELSLANVGGVFVVLLGGLGISFLVAIAEFMWRARRRGSTRDRMCDEMMSDLKFALACKRSTKPVPTSSTPSVHSHRKSQSKTSTSGAANNSGSNKNIDSNNNNGSQLLSTTAARNKRRLQLQQRSHLSDQQSSLLSQLDTIVGELDGPMAMSATGSVNPAILHQLSSSSAATTSAGRHQVAAAAHLLQQSQQQQQQLQQQDYCDPVLLQAMLAMLKKQQQAEYLAGMLVAAPSGQTILRNAQQDGVSGGAGIAMQQQFRDAASASVGCANFELLTSSSNNQHEPTRFSAAGTHNFGINNNIINDNKRCTEGLASVAIAADATRTPSWIPLSAASAAALAAARFEADKRRLIFAAQQTIDTTSTMPSASIGAVGSFDGNNFVGQHQHQTMEFDNDDDDND